MELDTAEGLRQFLSNLQQLEEREGFDLSVVKEATQKALDIKDIPYSTLKERITKEDGDKLAQLRKDLADEQGKTLITR